MNCRDFTKYWLTIVIVLTIPYPRALASGSNGCDKPLYTPFLIEGKLSNLVGSSLINDADLVEQVGNTQQLSINAPPFKTSNTVSLDNFWYIRVPSQEYPLSSNPTYQAIKDTQTSNPFNYVTVQHKGDTKIDCIDGTVVITGSANFTFNNLSKFTPAIHRARIDICIPVNGKTC